MGWSAGTGLGKNRQGLVKPVSVHLEDEGQSGYEKRGVGYYGERIDRNSYVFVDTVHLNHRFIPKTGLVLKKMYFPDLSNAEKSMRSRQSTMRSTTKSTRGMNKEKYCSGTVTTGNTVILITL